MLCLERLVRVDSTNIQIGILLLKVISLFVLRICDRELLLGHGFFISCIGKTRTQGAGVRSTTYSLPGRKPCGKDTDFIVSSFNESVPQLVGVFSLSGTIFVGLIQRPLFLRLSLSNCQECDV